VAIHLRIVRAGIYVFSEDPDESDYKTKDCDKKVKFVPESPRGTCANALSER
jgi:hypothetical protein